MRNRRFALAVWMALSGALLVPATAAYGQTEPAAGRVSVLVPFPAGTVTDIVARLYARRLTELTGDAYVVLNRPGAGGIIAAQALLAAPSDGKTMMFVSSAHATAPALNSRLPFDTQRDMAGVALVGATPTLLVVNPDAGIKSQRALVALAAKRQLSYGSAGIGSAAHFACENFAAQTNTRMLHVPYKGSTEYVVEVMAGRIDVACPPIASALPHIQAGKLVALAITNAERSRLLPDVPTTAESGAAGAEFGIWYGAIVARSTPGEIVDRLASQIKSIAIDPETVKALEKLGISGKPMLRDQFDRFLATEIDRYRSLVKLSGIEVQ